MVLEHVRLGNSKGSVVHLDTSTLTSHSCWLRKSIDVSLWNWKVVVSTSWVHTGWHINELECRAYLIALKWRVRRSASLHGAFLHLIDSMVTLGVASSWILNQVVEKIAAVELAGFLVPFLGFVHSAANSADAPSSRRAPGRGSSAGAPW